MSKPVSSKILPTVVWFKRDLRLSDHAALVSAASAGPVLPLYVVEPEYWSLSDTSYRQWEFLRGAVVDLQSVIRTRGGQLCIYVGSVQAALDQINSTHGRFRLVSHMETGNAWTYTRDTAVAKWCEDRKIQFEEYQQYGVWRGSDLNRNKWAKSWDAMMYEPMQRCLGRQMA